MPNKQNVKNTRGEKDNSRQQRSSQPPTKNRRKKKIAKKGSIAIARTAATLIVILLLLFVATETFGVATLSSISDSMKSFVASLSKGEGYPYRISSSSVKDIDMLSSNLFLLTDSATISLDSTAKEIAKIDHTYTTPSMSVGDGRAVIYDRGGYRYMVQSRTEKLHSKETKEKIITCDIGKTGNVAVATLEKDSTEIITVYSSNFSKVQFKWASYSDNVVDISLSDNGKYMAVATIGASDGEVLSKVYMFDFDYAKALAVFKYPGTSMLDIEFSDRDTVVAVGDNLKSVIKNKTERQDDMKFGTSKLMRYSMSSNGKSALILAQYGSSNLNVLKAYDNKGNELFSKKIENTVKKIYCNQNSISVLLDNRVEIYNMDGELKDTISSKNDSIKVLTYGKHVYIYAVGEIRQYS